MKSSFFIFLHVQTPHHLENFFQRPVWVGGEFEQPLQSSGTEKTNQRIGRNRIGTINSAFQLVARWTGVVCVHQVQFEDYSSLFSVQPNPLHTTICRYVNPCPASIADPTFAICARVIAGDSWFHVTPHLMSLGHAPNPMCENQWELLKCKVELLRLFLIDSNFGGG